MNALPRARTMAIVPSWIEAHCVVPDGFRVGAPLRLYDYQLLYTANFYLVRGDAEWIPDNPVLGHAFVYSRGIIAGPQKLGKNPMGAAQVCAEAEGPVLFADWAGKDDGYSCEENGCGCGWEYAYDPGEPMGMAWPTPLIQITAFSQDQTDNTWDVLRPMIQKGPLNDLIPKTGEMFIRLRGADDQARIEVVTSSEQSRLGARTSFVLQDQLEQWWEANGMRKVADAQYRNLAGTGGRASLLANAWDPTQHSVAQREFESSAPDVYRQATWAPTQHPCNQPEHDHFGDVVERRRIFEVVYPEDVRRENGGHVDLDSIDSEAVKIFEYDPPQARRYFGNERDVQGSGKAFDVLTWNERRVKRPKTVPDKALITIGVDGSVRWDHFPLIATDVAGGYQWPLHIWTPNGPGREVDVDAVEAVLEQAFDTWEVWRLYGDPPYIESWLAKWSGKWGKDRVIPWETASTRKMAYALRAYKASITSGELSHCHESNRWCALFSQHIGNAVRRDTGYQDDEGFLWTVQKDRPGSPNKIDSVPAGALSWQARNDAIASGTINVPVEVSAYETYQSLLA